MRASYAHISLQVQDGIPSMREDLIDVVTLEKRRGVGVLTGTEANSNKHWAMIVQVLNSFAYSGWRRSDCWVGIQRDRIMGKVDAMWYPILDGVAGKFTDKGILRVTYTDKWLGKVTHLVSHYLTVGQSQAHPDINGRIMRKLAVLAEQYGAGTAKVFFSGDVNLDDLTKQVVPSSMLTCWDELKQYPNTHGSRTIDVFARYKRDTRVKLAGARTRPGLGLKGDHKLIEVEYDIVKPVPGDPDPKPPSKPLASPPVIDGTPAKHSGEGNKVGGIQRIVIHSAVMPCEPGRARQLGHMNSVGSGGGSWHYSVDPKETFQCSYDRFVCWHAPPNNHSIGIEMADNPSAINALRWAGANHKAMLRRTAEITAELCVVHNVPPVFRTAAELKAGKRGITTHAQVTKAFGQSTHWDPGMWPRRAFMKMVREHYDRVK